MYVARINIGEEGGSGREGEGGGGVASAPRNFGFSEFWMRDKGLLGLPISIV